MFDDFLADEAEPTATRPDDRKLNPYRVPATAAAHHLIATIIGQVEAHQETIAPRERKRRAADQATFEAAVTAVVADLVHRLLIGSGKGVSLSRSNDWPRPRYRTPVHTKALGPILDALSQGGLGYVRQMVGHRGFKDNSGLLTSLMPTDKLADLVHSSGVDEEDFRTVPPREVIRLKSRKQRDGKKVHIDYAETAETKRLRDEITRLNEWLATTELEIDEGALAAGELLPDVRQRALYRQFTQGSFEYGGRLWGGFWQDASRELRRSGLYINGERAVELDYGQAGARILYGMAEATVPEGDLYAVPGFERHRDGIKQVLSSMTFADQRLVRMPDGVKKHFRKQHTATKVTAAIEAHHLPIAHLFFNGVGHRAQRIESDIMVATLLRLIDRQVVALPIHDAVMVPRSAAHVTAEIMLEVFREKAGVVGHISSIPEDVHLSSLTGEEEQGKQLQLSPSPHPQATSNPLSGNPAYLLEGPVSDE
jgi:hypothetical protein